MRLNLFIFIAAITLTLAATVYFENNAKPAAQKKQAAAQKFEIVPDFSVTSLNGTAHNIQSLRRKTVIINFWASWCLPCLAEFPALLDVAERNHDNVILLAVSSDETIEDTERFLKKIDRKQARLDNVIIAHDKNKSITHDLFQTFKLPETIIVSPDGYMIYKLVGADWSIEDLQAIIEKTAEQHNET